jgi:hypothetical protein
MAALVPIGRHDFDLNIDFASYRGCRRHPHHRHVRDPRCARTLHLFGVITMTTNENATIHIKVKDYSSWRKSYDENEKNRLSAGITNGRVFRRAEDPNDVVILQDVADVPKARSWFGSDDMKAAMQKSGVIGSPSIRFAA